jgi:hypothetical protein
MSIAVPATWRERHFKGKPETGILPVISGRNPAVPAPEAGSQDFALMTPKRKAFASP